MKKLMVALMIVGLVFGAMAPSALAVNTATHGKITGRTAVSGLTSLLLWPGIGQYLNHNEVKKNWTHAILGITGIFRFWSGWDALIDRQGGRWDGKI